MEHHSIKAINVPDYVEFQPNEKMPTVTRVIVGLQSPALKPKEEYYEFCCLNQYTYVQIEYRSVSMP